MIWRIIATIILAATSGVGYRMGGSGHYPRWTRLAICAGAMGLCALIWGFFTFWVFLSVGALVGALTTYWKKKGTDAKWYNWMFTFTGYALAMLPLAWYYHIWLAYAVFFVVLVTLGTLWATLVGFDIVQEIGRGVILILTMLILFISKYKKEKKQ